MAVIVIGGMISLGKSTVCEKLADALGSTPIYEKVEGNRVLEKFYTASEQEAQEKRYPFLLQLEFLSSRYQNIKQALSNDNNVLDRSVWEDKFFKDVNHQLGRISDLESILYDELLENMMEELEELEYKKAPDLMVYLTGSFETVLERIKKRGRDFELDPSLEEYYRALWSQYDEWIYKHYKASDIVVIDMDKYDVTVDEHWDEVLGMIMEKLNEVRKEFAEDGTVIKHCEVFENDYIQVSCDREEKDVSISIFESDEENCVILSKEDGIEVARHITNYFKK